MTQKTLTRALLVALVAAGVALAITYRSEFSVSALETWVESFGIWAPLVFIAAYTVAAVFCLPGLLFTVAAGALFGPAWGAVYSLLGATAGATVAFLIARYVASDWIAARTGGLLKQVIDGVEREGWRFVAMTRLIPLIPFNLLNYILGLSRIPLLHYVVASFICMAPGAAAYAYLGFAGREAATGSENWIEIGLLALGAIALIAFLPSLVRRIRRKRDGSIAKPGDLNAPAEGEE